MQTIEKALHQPMPFTTGGQTITDRLTAAKHSLAGSQLGKTICKATTEELMAPKKKHLDCKFNGVSKIVYVTLISVLSYLYLRVSYLSSIG
jgi:hypothetical protein